MRTYLVYLLFHCILSCQMRYKNLRINSQEYRGTTLGKCTAYENVCLLSKYFIIVEYIYTSPFSLKHFP